jgi:hypothetical protein
MTRLRVITGPTLAIIGAVISIAGVLDPVQPIALLAGLVLAILGVLAITAELEHRDTLAHGVDAHRQAMQALRPPNTWTPRKDHS